MGNKRWTKEECDKLKAIYKNFSNKELSKIFNRGEGAIEYKKNQLGLTMNIKDKDRGDQHFFDVIDNEEKAYWLGFIYADGYIVKSDGNYELGIELNYKDVNHLRKFNKIFNNYYKINKKIHSYNSIEKLNNIPLTDRTGEMCSIRVYSKSICEGLMKNNVVQNKTYSKLFPKIEDKNLFLHFLRGYIDGDGSYVIRNIVKEYKNVKKYKYPLISIEGNSIDMFNYIINKLENDFNIKADVCRDRNSYKLQIRRKDDCMKLINLMYDNATVYLDRKFDKVNEIKSIAV